VEQLSLIGRWECPGLAPFETREFVRRARPGLNNRETRGTQILIGMNTDTKSKLAGDPATRPMAQSQSSVPSSYWGVQPFCSYIGR